MTTYLGNLAIGLSSWSLFFRLLANDVEDTVFESLLVFRQPVLLPGVVEDPAVKVVPLQARFKEANASPIVGLLLKFEGTAVLHELSEFRWVAATKLLQRSLNLFLLDRIVFLVLAATWQTLPWERSLNQVEENMADCFQIIASALFNALMGRDRGIPGSPSEILTVLVRNMLALTVLIALGQTEVNDENVVSSGLSASDQEVIGLDITMDDTLLMHFLNSLNELRADQKDRFKVELSTACLE